MRACRRYLVGLALVGALFSGPALAETGSEFAAALNTHAYHPIPPNAKVEVEVLNDTEFNLEVGAAFAEAFVSRGIGTEGKGRLVLSFDTIEQFTAADREYIGEILVDTEQERQDLRLNMWSTTRNSLLNRNLPETASGRFLIVAILYDRDEKRRVWEAEASAPANVRHDIANARKLVPLVADHLGETVRNQLFDLY